jgi:SAM-dependent methyltransferase
MYLNLTAFHQHHRVKTIVDYYTIGARIYEMVRQIVHWRFGGFGPMESFLDFACGSGRVTRFFLQDLDPIKIWVSDISENAVAYQTDAFGVHGILSVYDPHDFRPDRCFDLIVVSSLFSHLPQDAFRAWLRKLLDLLTPEGILVISVHDMRLLPDSTAERKGNPFVFVPKSEDPNLDPQQYGVTYVEEAYVREAIAENLGGGGASVESPPALTFTRMCM